MNQTKKKLFSLVLACAVMQPMAAVSFAANAYSKAATVRTDSTGLNVRAAGSASSQIKTSLARGSSVTLIEKSGDWWKVEYASGAYGYCSSAYLVEQKSSSAAKINTNSGRLNVRSAPSTSASVITSLPKGETVVVTSSQDGWSKILYHGTKSGYVRSSYLANPEADNAQTGYKKVSLAVPSYKQYDSRWASMQVGSSGQNMKAIGCTVTALAMTESYRTKKTLTPAAMLSRLSFTSGGAVYWPEAYTAYKGSDYLKQIYAQLASGTPVIVGAKKASGKAHWVVVTGFLGGGLKASSFTVLDPGSERRTTLAHLFDEYPYFYKLEYAA